MLASLREALEANRVLLADRDRLREEVEWRRSENAEDDAAIHDLHLEIDRLRALLAEDAARRDAAAGALYEGEC
jgi:hypothetical protein